MERDIMIRRGCQESIALTGGDCTHPEPCLSETPESWPPPFTGQLGPGLVQAAEIHRRLRMSLDLHASLIRETRKAANWTSLVADKRFPANFPFLVPKRAYPRPTAHVAVYCAVRPIFRQWGLRIT
jgi:hypothetical protein